MCGLAGFTGGNSRTVVASMLESLVHRGPDSSGTHFGSTITLGHRRLVIIDPYGGDQPCVDSLTGDALIFNGEIYAYQKHADQLRSAGIKLKDKSDTEVLFRTLQCYGVKKTLDKVDGMFAFAYFDGKHRTLSLVRDRFGEKPLFYGVRDGQLVFASEIKALRKHPAFRNVGLDPNAVHRFLTFEYLPGDESGYEHIRKLKPGTIVTFKDGELDEQIYWRPKIGGAPRGLTEDNALDELDQLLNESVRQRLIADVPVGLFLSGGVDSGLLTAMAQRHAQNITAYTVKMPDQSYDETPHAKRIAQHCGVEHKIVELTDSDVSEAFGSVADMLDEPLADYSLLPTYMVCRAARKGMTVALSGDGGDELFGGYQSFSQIPAYVGTLGWIPGSKAIGAALRVLSAPVIGRLTSPKYASLLEYAGGYGSAYLLRRGLYLPWELPQVMDPDMALDGLRALNLVDRLEAGVTGIGAPADKVSALEMGWYMQNQLLMPTGRAWRIRWKSGPRWLMPPCLVPSAVSARLSGRWRKPRINLYRTLF